MSTTRFSKIVLSTLVIFGLVFSPSSLLADKNSAQTGEIKLELEGPKKEDPYLVTKRGVLKKLTNLKDNLEGGKLETPDVFNVEELNFLAAHHLYCSLQKGVCKLIPYTLFEMDMIRIHNTGKKDCMNLTRFWKQWLEADMDNRVGHNLAVTHYNKRSEFTSKIRPQLLNCSKTAKTLLARTEDPKKYLTDRYQPGKKKTELPDNLIKYIVSLDKRKSEEYGGKFSIYRETNVRR